MAAISQAALPNVFSCMKIHELRFDISLTFVPKG